jgi:hypothetical protein
LYGFEGSGIIPLHFAGVILLGLSAEAKKAFNALYREKRTLAQHTRVIFPPYPVALKRVEARADPINKLVADGVPLHMLPLSFWTHVFGPPQQARSILRTAREVQSLLAKQGELPDRCDACFKIGTVVIDSADDGLARGWLCDSCRNVASACSDPRVLHSIADYLSRAISKQNQVAGDNVWRLRSLRRA